MENETITMSSVTKKKYTMPQKFMHISNSGVVFKFIAGVNDS